MTCYHSFAYVYDQFMDNIPYDEWAEYVHELLTDYDTPTGLILELGAGTGNITRRLRDFGYDMIGLDLSEEMLEIAQQKELSAPATEGKEILYLHQDMRSFELYGTVAAVVAICDSMNYMTKAEDLKQVFRLVNNYLDRGGVFIFDLNTEYYYREELGDRTFADNREDCSLIWENEYNAVKKINEYDITIYAQNRQGSYERSQETHRQRAYSLKQIKKYLDEAGMEFVAAYDAFTKEAPKEDSSRIYVVAREQLQPGKLYR